MTREEIKAALKAKGITQTQIATAVGRTRGSVGKVIAGRFKSQLIRDAIAYLIDRPVDEIWPPTEPTFSVSQQASLRAIAAKAARIRQRT